MTGVPIPRPPAAPPAPAPIAQRVADVHELVKKHPTPWRAEEDGGWVRLKDAHSVTIDVWLIKSKALVHGLASAVNLAAAVRP